MSERPDLDIASDPALESGQPAHQSAAESTPSASHHEAETSTDAGVGPDGAAPRAAAHRDPAAQPAPAFSEPVDAKPPGGRRRRERPPLTGAITIVRPSTPPVGSTSTAEVDPAPESSTDDASATISEAPTSTVDPPAEVAPEVVPDAADDERLGERRRSVGCSVSVGRPRIQGGVGSSTGHARDIDRDRPDRSLAGTGRFLCRGGCIRIRRHEAEACCRDPDLAGERTRAVGAPRHRRHGA